MGEIVRYLPHKKKTKFRLLLKLWLLCRLRPKSAKASPQHLAHSSRFHPNRFTFCGVVAERVNAIHLPRNVANTATSLP